MDETLKLKIRKFEAKDRAQLRQIAHDTAFMGKPASIFFDGQELISDALTLYFTDYEPESCFVADTGQEIAGYLIGAKDKNASENIFNRKILPGLLFKLLKSGGLLKAKNIVFVYNCLIEMFKGGFCAQDFRKQYPATLHINIKEGFRGQNIGARLLAVYLDYLKTEAIPGVVLATMSDQGADFFLKSGFTLLRKGKRSYFKHILGKDVPLYIMGRKL